MAIQQRKELIKLEDAINKSKEQQKALQWFTNGFPIKCDLQLPAGSLVVKTSIVVADNDSCMILLLCKMPFNPKISVISGGDFSSVDDLKAHHPKLFKIKGTMELL